MNALLVGLHVAAGGVAVVTGATAALAAKRPGRHPVAGRVYLVALGVLAGTAAGLAATHWPRDNHLLALGGAALLAALTGFAARRRRRRGWIRWHIAGLGGSYLLMLTAFYVDNGPRLPVWQLLPDWTFWFLPAVVGGPVLVRALRRHGARGLSRHGARGLSRHGARGSPGLRPTAREDPAPPTGRSHTA